MAKQNLDGEARERLIIWIRRRMDEWGITPEHLAASMDKHLYRDAKGNEWDGCGALPDWVKIATNAGVGLDFFRVDHAVAQHARTDDSLLRSSFFQRHAG